MNFFDVTFAESTAVNRNVPTTRDLNVNYDAKNGVSDRGGYINEFVST